MEVVEEKMEALAADDVDDDDISFTSLVNDKSYYNSLTPETLLQIKLNDPDFTSLRVKIGDNNIGFRLSGNEKWQRDAGVSIGGNTHLKNLCVELHPIIEGSFKSFCRGVASNRSIETLTFERSYLFEDTFAILSPFLEKNKCLSNIQLIGCEIIGNGIHHLSKALSERIHKGSLSELKIWSCDISGGAQATAELMNSLQGYHNLVNFKWAFSNFCGRDGYVALANILQNPLCHLKKLDLSHTSIDDEINVLASALRTNKTLKLLKLRGCGIGDQSATALGNALANNNVLKALQLDINAHITSEGWRGFSVCLQNTNSALDRLSIQECSIDDESMAELASALANNSTLKILELSNSNYRINDAGWQAFSECLRSPNTALEKVDMTGCKITDEVIILFSEALARNTRLRELSICGNTLLTSRSWMSLSNLVCNKSSIDTIYMSNHTLCKLNYEGDFDFDLEVLLTWNRIYNKSDAARLKMLRYHFVRADNIIIEDFIDMEMAVLPRAISWIGRDFLLGSQRIQAGGMSQDLLYKLLLSMPSLFDSDHKAKAIGDKKHS